MKTIRKSEGSKNCLVKPFFTMTPSIANLIADFGNPPKPREITQHIFEYDEDNSHILRLCDLNGSLPDARDLYCYIEDINYISKYEDIQKDLFQFLLPTCLLTWQEYLLNDNEEYRGYIELLANFLATTDLYPEILSKKNYMSVSRFYADTILTRMVVENSLSHLGMRASPYKWFYSLATFCISFPNLKYFWEKWTRFNSEGHKICYLMYMSCLIYNDNSNPIFAPWTPSEGGGPPLLWECDGHVYGGSWPSENTEYLRTALSYNRVFDHMKIASHYGNENLEKVAIQILNDLEQHKDHFMVRVNRFIEIVSQSVDANSWDE